MSAATHVDDWLDDPASNETERLVKEWLERKFSRAEKATKPTKL